MEEDWRGARAWSAAQKEYVAEGETLDPSAFIPPAVSEAQNLGALPYFQVERTGETEVLSLVKIWREVAARIPSNSSDINDDKLPFIKAESNSQDVAKRLRNRLSATNRGSTPRDDLNPAAIFAQACPELAVLRSESATRTECRFELDYGAPQPWRMSYAGITGEITVARVLTYDAQLQILSRDPTKALDDILVCLKIMAAMSREPCEISGMVSQAILITTNRAIAHGLAAHAWSDAQLIRLDTELGRVDFLASGRYWLQGELTRFEIPENDYLERHRGKFRHDEALVMDIFGDRPLKRWLLFLTYRVIPNGWFEQDKADHLRHTHERSQILDPAAHRAYPDLEHQLTIDSDDLATKLFGEVTPDHPAWLNYVRNDAFAQVMEDEARIACRLERWRLNHGSYPPSLGDLGPVPQDIMSGDNYIYLPRNGGTFLLYSLGWNQNDDHGDAGQHKSKDSPDWVW
jgi:hypothetical protein